MVRVKRLAGRLMGALILMLLGSTEALAGGGVFPSFPGEFGFMFDTSSHIRALIVLDPNGPVLAGAPATATGTFGTIVISRRNQATATAVFRVQPDSSLGELQFGCNRLLTSGRFVEFSAGVPGLPLGGPGIFSNWLPSDITMKLFAELGITLFDPNTFITLAIPGVAEVVSQRCVPFPRPRHTLETILFEDIIERFDIRPQPRGYPDLSGNSVGTDPATQWVPGFLVLEVKIGLWVQPSAPVQ
jgi:hypothetical protein